MARRVKRPHLNQSFSWNEEFCEIFKASVKKGLKVREINYRDYDINNQSMHQFKHKVEHRKPRKQHHKYWHLQSIQKWDQRINDDLLGSSLILTTL